MEAVAAPCDGVLGLCWRMHRFAEAKWPEWARSLGLRSHEREFKIEDFKFGVQQKEAERGQREIKARASVSTAFSSSPRLSASPGPPSLARIRLPS